MDGKINCDHEAGEFEQKVAKIQEGCRRGDFFEVVLSQSFSTGFAEKPSTLFKRICEQNPSPYSFLINMGKEQLVGASPEMYVRVKEERFETEYDYATRYTHLRAATAFIARLMDLIESLDETVCALATC